MGTYFKAIDRFAASLTRGVIANRWLVIIGAVIFAGVVGSGASKLEFSTNYRVFFSEANPELQAFEELQNTYTKNDNFFFVVEPMGGAAFNRDTMAAVEELTDGGLADSLHDSCRFCQQLPAHLRSRRRSRSSKISCAMTRRIAMARFSTNAVTLRLMNR